jgi:hypothetical protein
MKIELSEIYQELGLIEQQLQINQDQTKLLKERKTELLIFLKHGNTNQSVRENDTVAPN